MSEQNEQVNQEMTNVTEKIPDNTEITSEKRVRGPDKTPRKMNPISVQNLKQNRINTKLSTDNIGNTEKVTSFNSKLLYWTLIFILILIVGAIIWKIYRDHMENRSK